MFPSRLRGGAFPAVILAAGLAGCAGSTVPGSYVPVSAADSTRANGRAGADTGPARPATHEKPKDRYLYVTDFADNAVKILRNANAVDPYFVTADARGNIYVGDTGNGSANGVVNEYFQGVNATVASCAPNFRSQGNAGVCGVAVDKNGDVFVLMIG